MNDSSLAIIQQETSLSDYAQERKKLRAVIKKAFKQGTDYGVIPGTNKQSLFQPGAEKIAKLFGLTPNYELLKEVEDFDKGFFYYKYKCSLTHFASGKFVGAAERSCNSGEKKYKNSYDKPGLVNTIQAMAQKRAFVAAVRVATGASEIFGEDDIEVDEAPSSKVEPTEKELAMKRLHVVGSERGFGHEKLSTGAKTRYEVNSLTECTLEQLTEMIDELEMKWQVVGAGQKPKKTFDDKPVVEVSAQEAMEVLEAQPITCYQCDAPLPHDPTDDPLGYFCCEDHKNLYWAKKKKASK